MSRKTICVDFDGTISQYDGWEGNGNYGDPLPNVVKALHSLKALEYKIIIFTTRAEDFLIAEYLEKHNIPFDEINRNSDNPPYSNMGKPIADYYIDDRAIEFKDNWIEIAERIISEDIIKKYEEN